MLTGVSLTRSPAAGQQSLLGSDSGVTHRVTDESEPRVEPVHGRLRPLTPGPPKRAIVVVGREKRNGRNSWHGGFVVVSLLHFSCAISEYARLGAPSEQHKAPLGLC